MATPTEDHTGWAFNPRSLQQKYNRRYRGERLTAERVGRVLSDVGKRAGIVVDEGNPRTGSPVKYASCHDLRRTFAMILSTGLKCVRRIRRMN